MRKKKDILSYTQAIASLIINPRKFEVGTITDAHQVLNELHVLAIVGRNTRIQCTNGWMAARIHICKRRVREAFQALVDYQIIKTEPAPKTRFVHILFFSHDLNYAMTTYSRTYMTTGEDGELVSVDGTPIQIGYGLSESDNPEAGLPLSESDNHMNLNIDSIRGSSETDWKLWSESLEAVS